MFEKLVGNKKVKEYLKLSIENKSVSNSYMFVGKSGIGKKLFAREFAKKIMCLDFNRCEDKSPCKSCLMLNKNSNPDYLEITPDGKTIKIEQIRKLQEKIAEKPIISNRKIYVIDDADLMSEESQNCLLKTLEEPPEYAVIILIASNEKNLLSTIRSRCILVKFDSLTNDEIRAILPNIPDEFISTLDGSLQNATNILEKQDKFKEIKNIVSLMEKASLPEIFSKCDLLYSSKDDIISLLEYLNIVLFEKRFINCVEIVEKTKKKILSNNNYDMCIDYMLMHIWEEINEKNNRS